MTAYVFEDELQPGMAGLNSRYGRQIFVCGKARREAVCEVLSVPIARGDESWRPLGNTQNRWHRISAAGMKRLRGGVRVSKDRFIESEIPPVLDACCGSRMFWFDRNDSRAVFMDCRREVHVLPDASSAGGSRVLRVEPDMVSDFRAMPWADNVFALVVFDPPHLLNAGENGWQAKKYGKLGPEWREDLRRGFSECFRVLRPLGVLVFKWCEHSIPVSEILSLTPERPLFGQRCGKAAKTHWIVFIKGGVANE